MSTSSGKPVKRNFTITESTIGYEGGKYSTNKSGTPLSAAQRAASKLFQMAQNKKGKAAWKKFESSNDLIKFTIRETTRGSDKEVRQYEAKIKKLPESEIKTVKRGDVEYTVTHKIVCRSAHYTPIKGGEVDEL
jgi:hypothetical protein